MFNLLFYQPISFTALLFFLFPQIIRASEYQSLEYHFHEELQPGSYVGNIIQDLGLSSRYNVTVLRQLRLSFLTQPKFDRAYFAIDEQTGDITSTHSIDREKLCPRLDDCIINFDVAIQPVQFFQIVKVKVEIVDVNDNAPVFPDQRVFHQISELAELGTGFVIPAATDPDSGRNGIQRYDIVRSGGGGGGDEGRGSRRLGSGSDPLDGGYPDDGKFSLSVRKTADGGTDVRLILKARLDREEEERFEIRVAAIDGGIPPKTGSILVSVTVQDANDNYPEFENASYEIHVPENLPAGSVITKVRARDRDSGINAVVAYEFSPHTVSAHGHLFGIKSESGKIYLKSGLDFETSTTYLLSVSANDRGPDSLPAHASLVVRVDDVNDNAPQISINTLTSSTDAEVKENSEVGTFVAHLSVVDADSGENGRVLCSVNHRDFALQQIYPSELKIVTATVLDREEVDSYSLSISCEDFGSTPSAHTSELPLKVRVTDDNDNTPLFDRPDYETSILENAPPGTSIIQVSASDADTGPNGRIEYKLEERGSNGAEGLLIDSQTGIITSASELDRETYGEILVNILAVDKGQPQRSSRTRLRLKIKDVDDNRPRFVRRIFSFSARENDAPVVEIGAVTAVDKDTSPFSRFTYWLVDEWLVKGLFQVDPKTGTVTTLRTLDREEKAVYNFSVGVRSLIGDSDQGRSVNRGAGGGSDWGGTRQGSDGEDESRVGEYSDTAVVIVHVSDTNDHAPSFTYPSLGDETLVISSQTPRGDVIARLTATDLDTGVNSNLTYHVMTSPHAGNRNNAFSVAAETGALIVNADLSMIAMETFVLGFTVRDSADPSLSDTAQLRVVVNKDIPYIPPPPTPSSPHPPSSIIEEFGERVGGFLASEDMVIVLAFTLATILLAIIIIIAIICLYRRRRLHYHSTNHRRSNKANHVAGCPNESTANQQRRYISNGSVCTSGYGSCDDGAMQCKPLLRNGAGGGGGGALVGNGKATAVVNAYVKLNGSESGKWKNIGKDGALSIAEDEHELKEENQASYEHLKQTVVTDDLTLTRQPSWILDISPLNKDGNDNCSIASSRVTSSNMTSSLSTNQQLLCVQTKDERRNPVVVFIRDQSETADLQIPPSDSRIAPSYNAPATTPAIDTDEKLHAINCADLVSSYSTTNHNGRQPCVGGTLKSTGSYQTLPTLRKYGGGPMHNNCSPSISHHATRNVPTNQRRLPCNDVIARQNNAHHGLDNTALCDDVTRSNFHSYDVTLPRLFKSDADYQRYDVARQQAMRLRGDQQFSWNDRSTISICSPEPFATDALLESLSKSRTSAASLRVHFAPPGSRDRSAGVRVTDCMTTFTGDHIVDPCFNSSLRGSVSALRCQQSPSPPPPGLLTFQQKLV